jgi:thiol-disulfide isomerase/thioredoxin
MASNIKKTALSIFGIFALSACSSVDPLFLNDNESVITQMELRASDAAIAKGYSTNLSVIGTFEDGTTQDITDRVTLVTSDTNILQISGKGRNASVLGVGEGGATITATLLPEGAAAETSWTAQTNVIVGPPVCQTIEVAPASFELKAGATRQLAATCMFSDGTSRDVTTEVNWVAQNANVLSVSAAGLVTATGELGSATVTASLGISEVTIEGTAVCGYPGESTRITNGGLFPGLNWAGAFTPTGEMQMLSLEDFHCADTYKDYKTVNFIVGTGWCPNCPDYMRRLEGIAAELEAAGGLLVYVEIQNNDRSASNSTDANTIVNRYIQSDVGWRVGDTDSSPLTRVFGAAITSIPDAFVVRKSDMQVIGHQRASNTYLDFVDMATAPEAY